MTIAPALSEPDVAAPPRQRRRAVWAWIAIAVVLLLVGGVGAALTSATEWSRKGRLDPDSAGISGTRALAQVLSEHGVEVRVARSLADARGAAGPDGTLVIASTSVLSDEALEGLADTAADVVLIDPLSRDLRVLFDGADTAGFGTDASVGSASGAGGPIPADCAQPEAVRAGEILPGELFTTGEDPATIGCYGVGDAFGLLVRDRSSASRTVAIDARELFTNEHLATGGNAALALGLLGRHPQLVWYMPSIQDSDLTPSRPSLGDLTPPWVTPAILLVLCAAAVAAVWRGRRFGPLVAENLPVSVRASETMEGRARLYARSRDAAHALDALRAGALDRLARMLGLGPGASAGAIADAAADRLSAPRDVVRGILIDDVPLTDAELVAASDRLRDLEAAVGASVRIERIDP